MREGKMWEGKDWTGVSEQQLEQIRQAGAQRSWRDEPGMGPYERMKLERDGLLILEDLPRICAHPQEKLSWEDTARLKWAGIYAQRPRDGKWMLHVQLPCGALSSAQARVLSDIARRFGCGTVQLTLRECVQIHSVLLPDLPEIFALLSDAGLTTISGGGDGPRVVMGSPLMGVDPSERIDPTDTARELMESLTADPAFSNLPRKCKIALFSSPADRALSLFNDLSFVPARRGSGKKSIEDMETGKCTDLREEMGKENKEKEKEQPEDGFMALIGGGLSESPRLAQPLPFFLQKEDILPVTRAVLEIYRERGDRRQRGQGRLKFLVEQMGISALAAEIEALTGPLPRGGQILEGPAGSGTCFGVHPQRQEGLFRAGCAVPGGRLSSEELCALADAADRYGDGSLRLAPSQNVLLTGIPVEMLPALRRDPLFSRFPLEPGKLAGYAAACTGMQFCNFAAVETRHLLQGTLDALQAEFPDLPQPVRVAMSGCSHACARPQLADIGLTGAFIRSGQGRGIASAVTVRVGGTLQGGGRFGDLLAGRVPVRALRDLLRDLLQLWLTQRRPQESFADTGRRLGSAPYQEIVDRYRAQ